MDKFLQPDSGRYNTFNDVGIKSPPIWCRWHYLI